MVHLNKLLNVLSVVSETPDKSAAIMQLLFIVIMFVAAYFLIINPQKKKQKEALSMISTMDIGDEVVTVSGIIGTVVTIKEDYVVIETSGDRNKIRIQKWGIKTNNTATERSNSSSTPNKPSSKK